MESMEPPRSAHQVEAVAAWQKAAANASPAVRRQVAERVREAGDAIVREFYTDMLEHPQAGEFLSHDMVQQRLHAAMLGWLTRLFADVDDQSLNAAVAHQVEVGAAHARIKLPAELMSMGMRAMKRAVRRRAIATFESPDDRLAACQYIDDLIHLADGLMSSAYIRDVERNARSDEAFRSTALKHDATLERERQRAALSDWGHRFLLSLRRRQVGSSLRLGNSEFALWMNHKARVLFDGMVEVQHVFDVIEQVDEVLIPQLLDPDLEDAAADGLIDDLERQVEFIRYLVGDLFERLNQTEQGRDSLTGLYNRRYLLTVARREIDEHRRKSEPFCMLLIKPERPAQTYTEETRRNVLLQQIALVIQDHARSGDYVFRYAEDVFLVLAVETDADTAAWRAEELRKRVRTRTLGAAGNATPPCTVSIGLGAFDGHPDYQYLLQRAETALLRAQNLGGDRVETA